MIYLVGIWLTPSVNFIINFTAYSETSFVSELRRRLVSVIWIRRSNVIGNDGCLHVEKFIVLSDVLSERICWWRHIKNYRFFMIWHWQPKSWINISKMCNAQFRSVCGLAEAYWLTIIDFNDNFISVLKYYYIMDDNFIVRIPYSLMRWR